MRTMRTLILMVLLVLVSQAPAQSAGGQCSIPTPLVPPASTALRARDITGEFNCSCSGTGSCSLTVSGGVMFCTGACSGSCALTIVVDPRLALQGE